jgi:glycosyltransferase involved in cell wall biosynthesis
VDHITSALTVWLFTLIAHLKRARTVIVHSLALTEQRTFDLAGWAGFWRRILFAGFDWIVAVSPGLYTGLKPLFPKTARLIVNGVRDDIFAPLAEPARQLFRAAHGVGEAPVVFTFLGTVGQRKGFDVLAQAFAHLARMHPHWRLWVIGPYTTEHSQNLDPSEVRRVTSVLDGLGEQVKYWGRIDERQALNTILAASDVFVFPSRREGMGLAPVEAMSAGVPVIIARIPDVTDLANIDGETGLYVPVGDVVSLQTAMEALACDPALRQRMGQQAAWRVRDSFGWQHHLDAWEVLYSSFK